MTLFFLLETDAPQKDWMEITKPVLTVLCLTLLWTWETFLPLTKNSPHRWRHAGRNAVIAILNTVVLGVVFSVATVGVATWATENQFGVLYWLNAPAPWRVILAILLLDGWLYIWHRLNHRVPLLWRFHRTHHSDRQMDVTTATRFHLGEHLISATLRLGLIPLLGVTAVEILIFETLVVVGTMFHHANVSVGRFDRPLRCLIVTPQMHQVHHSRLQPETDSNYSVLFSFWDRLAQTFRIRQGDEAIEFGLDEFDDDRWQTIVGMLKTPFVGSGHNENAKGSPRMEGTPDENGFD